MAKQKMTAACQAESTLLTKEKHAVFHISAPDTARYKIHKTHTTSLCMRHTELSVYCSWAEERQAAPKRLQQVQ